MSNVATDLLARVCATYAGYLALGNVSRQATDAQFVCNDSRPRIYDANHLSLLRARDDDAVDALFSDASAHFSGCSHQYFVVDPLTPPVVEARLVQDGFRSSAELELLLDGDLPALRQVPGLEIRLAASDADWETIRGHSRMQEIEEANKFQRDSLDADTTGALVQDRRDKGPALRTWLARDGGVDCAHFSSWPGKGGVGKVEDLFTHPDHRRRGIASALIAHAVDDARTRGARAVLIGALPNDTPRRMYESLGFRPYCVMRGYLRDDAAS